MSNIANQHLPAGLSLRQHTRPDLYSAMSAKEESLKTRESTNSALIIETREGDRVTLSASSFSQMEAYRYSSEGVVQTESGTALFSQNIREITLASGQSFSFSVAGDLSDSELEDIEAILQGLDGVLSEMKQGDMSGAMEEAIGIGSFDSISSYSADLSVSTSYELRSATAAGTAYRLPDQQESLNPLEELLPEEQRSQAPVESSGFDFDRFLAKLFKQFEAHENKLTEFAQKPIEKLFEHHLKSLEKADEKLKSLKVLFEKAMGDVNSLLDDMVAGKEEVKPEMPAAEV